MTRRRATVEPKSVEFAEVRRPALAELDKGARTTSGQWSPCVWQGYRNACHVGPYRNTLSHLEALHDLLEHGTWCDHVVVVPWVADDNNDERLFRCYGLVFTAWSELVQDLRLIHGAALTGKQMQAKAGGVEELMGFVNHNFKHRNRTDGSTAFHQRHHHGPYLFADASGHETALPSDGRHVALAHLPPAEPPAHVPFVVPSLVDAMRNTSRALRQTSGVLREPDPRARVVGAYGVHRW